MRRIELVQIREYIDIHIGPSFHEKKLAKIKAITLNTILKRKNPYLFKAKGAMTANDLIESVLDATISSGEETIFGSFLEQLAIFICDLVHKGKKSSAVGIDLEFEWHKKHYLVSIKSGPNWGNSDQIKKMQTNFKNTKKTLRTSGGMSNTEIVAVEGCCYGSDDSPDKGEYQKLCGQRFWKLISGRPELYRELIEPLGIRAKERNEELLEQRTKKMNLLTEKFLADFCDEGMINWDKLVQHNSGAKPD
jgi:Type II restriction endonuclease EcoO109I